MGLLAETYKGLTSAFSAQIGAHGLGETEFEVMLRLVRSDGHRLRMSDLAAQTGLSTSGITRVVDRLERDGLVSRQTCASDRRGYWAALTGAGESRIAGVVEEHVALIHRPPHRGSARGPHRRPARGARRGAPRSRRRRLTRPAGPVRRAGLAQPHEEQVLLTDGVPDHEVVRPTPRTRRGAPVVRQQSAVEVVRGEAPQARAGEAGLSGPCSWTNTSASLPLVSPCRDCRGTSDRTIDALMNSSGRRLHPQPAQ